MRPTSGRWSRRPTRAHHDQDCAAILAQRTPDAVVFDLPPPLVSHLGTDPQALQGWLDTWERPIEREARDFEISVDGDRAFAYGFTRLRGSPKAAGQAVSFWLRATVWLRRHAPAPWVVHEHSSAPFYMGSLRPAFDLEP